MLSYCKINRFKKVTTSYSSRKFGTVLERGPTLSENPVLPKEQVWEGSEKKFEKAKQTGAKVTEQLKKIENKSPEVKEQVKQDKQEKLFKDSTKNNVVEKIKVEIKSPTATGYLTEMAILQSDKMKKHNENENEKSENG